MGAYVTPKQIERLVNPLLGDFLSTSADAITSVGKRELHEVFGLARYQTGQISKREMLDAGTLIQNFELEDNVPKGTMVEIDLNKNTSKYFDGDVIDLEGVDIPKGSPKPSTFEASEPMAKEDSWNGTYMWMVSEQHIMLGMKDICDTYHGNIYPPGSQIPKKPHQNCNCKLVPVDRLGKREYGIEQLDADGNKWEDRKYKTKGKKNGVGGGRSNSNSDNVTNDSKLADLAGDMASKAIVSALGLTGPTGIIVGIGADMILDKVFQQVANGLDKYVTENSVLSSVSDVIQTAQFALEVGNMFKNGRTLDGADELLKKLDPNAHKMFRDGRGLYSTGKSFIGDGTTENISNNIKKHIATTSKDRLNSYLMGNLKGYKQITESTRVLDKMNSKLPKVKTASDALELVSDMVTLGDKLGLGTSNVVNQKLLSKTKAKIILLESGMERMRRNGIVLY